MHDQFVNVVNAIEKLNEEGYSCCGIDVQSNGRSGGYKGLKNYFESFDDVIADDFAFIDKLPELGGKAFSSDLPLFPFGVSMGGARAALMMMKDETRFKGALLYAPMLSLERVSKNGRARRPPCPPWHLHVCRSACIEQNGHS